VVDANQARQDILVDFSDGIFASSIHAKQRDRAVLASHPALPDPCTRFAPYICGAGGSWRGQKQVNERFFEPGEGFDIVAKTGHTDAEAAGMARWAVAWKSG